MAVQKLTVTEALAEIRTILKRIPPVQKDIADNLYRQDNTRDPHDDVGGSAEYVKRKRQTLRDLTENIVSIRREIAASNAATALTCEGKMRSIADWLVWRREAVDFIKQSLATIQGNVAQMRRKAAESNLKVIDTATSGAKPTLDVILHVSESAVVQEIDEIETILGRLDGMLSVSDATTYIEIERVN